MESVKIGFTGSRYGASVKQLDLVAEILDKYKVVEIHHGDCKGFDNQAHDISVVRKYKIIMHPPTNPYWRAFKTTGNPKILGEKSYIDRDNDIVDACDILIGCPENPIKDYSGTWQTIQYAQVKNKKVFIFPKNK
jgi:hypothetical protein